MSASPPAKPRQLSADDVHRLTELGRPDEIERHRLAGRLDDLLGIERPVAAGHGPVVSRRP